MLSIGSILTVHTGNHVAYKRFKGRKSTPEEVAELYAGLKETGLANFDVMLSGYCPSASVVEEVGKIARDIKLKANTRPGSFFWALDPVMGDNGRLYVPEETVPIYKGLLRDADLIVPNQFEAELLSDVKIHDLASISEAITKLHQEHNLPHIIITSVRLPNDQSKDAPPQDSPQPTATLSVVGSTATSESKPRLFRITVPAFPIMFSGTGDMFAALVVARLRQAAHQAELLDQAQWRSPDDVAGSDLPLAKATEKALASMNAVLQDTASQYATVAKSLENEPSLALPEDSSKEAVAANDMQHHLRLTRAAEVRVVQNTEALRNPPQSNEFRAYPL
jgi:pyridoxine kinase